MGYFDKWYSWLFTPLSSMVHKTASGLGQAVGDIVKNDNNGQPRWSNPEQFIEEDWNKLIEPFGDQIQQLRDNGYGDLVDSALAQWKGSFSAYKPGLMDALGHAFGARNGQQKYYENIAFQLGEALNGISQQRFQNEYDSPVQQASRERQAGINSDFAGIGDVAGSANPADDVNNTLPETSELSAEKFASFSEFLVSLPSVVLGIAKDYRSVKALGLSNEGMQISNEAGQLGLLGNIYSTTKQGILGAVDENDVGSAFTDPDSPVLDERTVELSIHKQLQNAKDRFLRIVENSGASKSLIKSIKSASEEYFGSMEYATEVADRRSKYFEAKVRKSRIRQSKYVGGDNHQFDSFIDSINKPLVQLLDAKTEFEAKYNALMFKNSSQYQERFGVLNGPNITASNDINQSIYTTQGLSLDNELKKLNKVMVEAQKQMTADLKKLADDGNFWARLGLYGLNIWSLGH